MNALYMIRQHHASITLPTVSVFTCFGMWATVRKSNFFQSCIWDYLMRSHGFIHCVWVWGWRWAKDLQYRLFGWMCATEMEGKNEDLKKNKTLASCCHFTLNNVKKKTEEATKPVHKATVGKAQKKLKCFSATLPNPYFPRQHGNLTCKLCPQQLLWVPH